MTARRIPDGHLLLAAALGLVDDAPPERVAEGTHPGRPVAGQRVSIAYLHVHAHRDRPPTAETRYAIARVLSILPDGALWVRADREGEQPFRVEAGAAEVVP